jgi:NTP pyrophosphatase (non-canonical NTP hydrolase)
MCGDYDYSTYSDADQYQLDAMTTARKTDPPDQRTINAALGLAGEAGEIADMVKKWQFQGHDIDDDKMELELGDVLWYVAQMAGARGFMMSRVMERNVKKLAARYPDGFSAERSIHRDNN